MTDRAVVAIQIGRPPRSVIDVVARCHLSLPTVTAVPPHLDDGTPFPTRYWLTCPLAVRRIGRVEAQGGVRAAEQRIEDDERVRARHEAAMRRYAAQRDALIDPDSEAPRPSGGVAGSRTGVKCLHAHYADWVAGNDNPTGQWVEPSVEPLNCVAEIDGQTVFNPEWREPKR